MIRFHAFLLAMALLATTACTTSPTNETRNPATVGTGDIDSSTPGMEVNLKIESYKLPIVREGKTSKKMAHNFWSGEWPAPVVDVNAKKSGTTKISAYKSLRNPTPADRVSCTIKNGLYNPWSQKDPSTILYYTVTDLLDYKVIKKFTQKDTSYDGKPSVTTYPAGAEILNVVYYAENLCGATLKIGKNLRPVSADCPFFMENPNLERTSPGEIENEFREQWIYLTCEEKDEKGQNIKAFVQDKDLLSQPGIKEGCFGEYGHVRSCL